MCTHAKYAITHRQLLTCNFHHKMIRVHCSERTTPTRTMCSRRPAQPVPTPPATHAPDTTEIAENVPCKAECTRDQPLVPPIRYITPQNMFSPRNYLWGNYPHTQLCITVIRKILNIYLHLLVLNATVTRMDVYLIIASPKWWVYREIRCSLRFCSV